MLFAAGRGGPFRRLFFLAPVAIAIAVVAVVATPPSAAALDGEEQGFLGLINQYRAANGLGQLSLNGTLNEAARWMSQDMAAKNYFSHTDSLGRDPLARINAFGYTYNTWKGENLAAGVESGQAAFDMWKASPGHNSNMLNPNFAVIGIARAYGPGTTFSWYWTTNFGGQGDPPPPAAAPPPPPLPAPPPPQPPPPAPAARAAPVTPAPVPAPAPEAAPELTPAPAPEPPPSPTPASQLRQLRLPNWRQIALQVKPWWDRLTVVDGSGSLLKTVSYMAERYLAFKMGNLVQSDDPRPQAGHNSPPVQQVWLTLFP